MNPVASAHMHGQVIGSFHGIFGSMPFGSEGSYISPHGHIYNLSGKSHHSRKEVQAFQTSSVSRAR